MQGGTHGSEEGHLPHRGVLADWSSQQDDFQECVFQFPENDAESPKVYHRCVTKQESEFGLKHFSWARRKPPILYLVLHSRRVLGTCEDDTK
jgi:hypothetical protein